MKMTRKVMTGIILGIFMLSLGMAAPLANAQAKDVAFQSYTGHSFSESSWSIIYDVAGDQVVKDYFPGPYAANISEGATDNNTIRDLNFYVAYANMGQIQTLYIANKNITLSPTNMTLYGCAPYQILINHFHTRGNQEVFVFNTFMGLLAYRENETIKNGVPNKNEELYMGWTAYSELYKHLFNQALLGASLPGYLLYNETERGTAEPIVMSHKVNGSENVYSYGISYRNIFAVWQSIDVDEALNDTAHMSPIIYAKNIVAVGLLSSLNFTYHMKGVNSTSGYTNVTITTEYEIGPMKSLWIINDNMNTTIDFGGYYFPTFIGGKSISLYNSSSSIVNRLSGKDNVPGFSLAVASYMDMVVLGVKPPKSQIQDKNGTTIDPQTQDRNITRAELALKVRNRAIKAFEMSTEGKDTYILNGDTTHPKTAVTKVIPNARLRNPIARHLYWLARDFLVKAFKTIYPDFGPLDEVKVLFNPSALFYLTCFPEWNGQSIVNDPTFTVFGGYGTSLGLSIPGSSVGLIAIVSLGAVTALIIAYKKKIRA
ncbi:MAG: hypothetical protein ACTSU2_14010 [Promethearchaeota archaeon]